MPRMRSVVAKILFVIDGVAERKTSRMLSASLESRLDFSCFVQVVANYVLAFDLAMQQDFDVIVLPHKAAIDQFSTDEFVEMVSCVAGFSASIIRTVDLESPSHVLGMTVRSGQRGSEGYLVDDLVAAIDSSVKNSPPRPSGLTKAHKRPRQESSESTHPSSSASEPQQPRHRSKRTRSEQMPSLHLPSDAEEAAYWQYCQWWQWNQWQLFLQAQGQPGHMPGQCFPQRRSHVATKASSAASMTIVTDSSAATTHSNTNNTSHNVSPFYTHHNHNHHMPHPYTQHHAHNSHSSFSFSPPHPTLFAPYPPSTYPYPPSQYPDFPPPSVQGYNARFYAGPAHHDRQDNRHDYCEDDHEDYHQEFHQDRHHSLPLRAARSAAQLSAPCAHVVSEDVFDDPLDHLVPCLTRDADLCPAEGSNRNNGSSSSTSSCTTAESRDSSSFDDAALQTDCYSNDPSDAIDDAEFAACFDMDSWLA